MSKSINTAQSEMLLNKMQQNPDIARGFVKQNREKVAEFWKRLTLELNSAGPPIKNECEWKKAWTDQKRYVRKKAALNKMHQRGTGGGPNKTQKFSPSEEAIFALIGMSEAIEGVGSSQPFGLRQVEETDENIPVAPSSPPDLIFEILDSTVPIPNQNDNPTSSDSQRCKKRKAVEMTTSQVVAEELEIQKKLYGEVREAVSVMREHNTETKEIVKKLCRSVDQFNENFEKFRFLEKDRYKEQKRHHMEMENFRRSELEAQLEKDKKLLELELRKIEIMERKG